MSKFFFFLKTIRKSCRSNCWVEMFLYDVEEVTDLCSKLFGAYIQNMNLLPLPIKLTM